MSPCAVKHASAKQAFVTLDERLKAMDAMAVDMEVLSVNPFWYRKERDLAAEIVRINNEKLAELCASKPDRFAAFASVALQLPDLAVEQLETAMKSKGCAERLLAAASPAKTFRTRNSIPSGPRPKSSARCSSSTHKRFRNWPSVSKAMAGSRTRLACQPRRQSRCLT